MGPTEPDLFFLSFRGLSLAVAWGCVAVFDCMHVFFSQISNICDGNRHRIFLLTLYKVFTRHRGIGLATVLLRDGTGAFVLQFHA
jgi:hypothetical protein